MTVAHNLKIDFAWVASMDNGSKKLDNSSVSEAWNLMNDGQRGAWHGHGRDDDRAADISP